MHCFHTGFWCESGFVLVDCMGSRHMKIEGVIDYVSCHGHLVGVDVEALGSRFVLVTFAQLGHGG